MTVHNAHPHRSGKVAVVHNGIIENFRDIRAEMTAKGLAFESQTDTESVVVLTRYFLDQGASPLEAVQQTVARLEGAFALCFIFDGENDLMIGARKGAPLAVGYGDDENFIGSDALALAPMTGRLSYLEDGDVALVTRSSVTIFDRDSRPANREVQRINIEQTRIEKAGYKHFMAKEIFEQPVVLADAIGHYCPDGKLNLPADLDFTTLDRLTLVACGTASYACQTAKYWFESLAGLPCEVDIASEFRYREPPLPQNSFALFVSQSGETADTLAALRYASGKVARIVSVVNVPTSSIARESDVALPILAGVEVGVASTKAFTCQLSVLLLLALKAGHDRGRIDADTLAAHLADLTMVPGLMNQALARETTIASMATALADTQDVLFLGRGAMFPLALEGALKLKEISYIHAEGYASGELKHGPIALIDNTVPVVVLAPRDALFDKTVSNMQEVMARHGRVLLITDATGAREVGEEPWKVLTMPDVAPLFAPILYAIPAQLLAYHAAVAKGTDVDQPRNLAKSVTVE